MGWFGSDDDEKIDGGLWTDDEEQSRLSNEVRFQEQCVIMNALFAGSKSFKNPTTSYKNFTKVIDSSGGSQIVSELTSVKGAKELFKLTSEEAAHLQPFIRFFKVQGTQQTEFPFSRGSFTGTGKDTSSIFKNKTDRGSEVGIKSVDFELLATQPEEITNNIRCNVRLFFQNLNGILKERSTGTKDPKGNPISIKYADLILRPRSADTALEAYEPEDYRVKLVVGWALTKNISVRRGLRNALSRTRTILNLTLKNHTFNFNMDGTAELDIEYHAWVEGSLSSPKTDLLYPGGSFAAKIDAAQKKIRKAKSKLDGDKPATDTQKKLLEELALDKALEKRRSRGAAYRRILDKIMEKNIYYADVDPSVLGIVDINWFTGEVDEARKKSVNAEARKNECADRRVATFNRFGGSAARGADTTSYENNTEYMNEIYESHKTPDTEPEDLTKSIQQATTEALHHLTSKVSPADPDKVRMHYFFLGDLLEAALDVLNANPEYKDSQISKTLILSGPIFLNDPCGDAETSAVGFNLADIPISLNVFQGWFIKKLINPGINNYLLRNLINDIIGELLPAALGGDCLGGAQRQLIRAETQPITFKGSKAITKGGQITVAKVRTKNQVLGFDAAQKKTDTQDCVLIYTSGFAAGWLKGKRREDMKRGIYHFDLGKSKGIIKNISFNKNDAPYLGEARVTGTGNIASDLGGGSIYNFDAELVGNGLFVPGQYVYVNPAALGLGVPGKGDPIASKLRLGGYYSIQKVESTLERGNFTTTVSGIWEADGSGKTDPAAIKPTTTTDVGP